MERRTFLKSSLAGGALAVVAGTGLLKPTRVLAADWNKAVFENKDLAAALKDALGTGDASASDKIELKAPDLAENGAVVPIKISTDLPNVSKIAVAVEGNPTPVVAVVNIMSGGGFFSARVKMGKTSNVVAYVVSDGKAYKASKEVKVTVGGCGG